MNIDDDTQKALLLFNRRAEAAEAAKATERRLAKAVKAKDEAADALKRAQDSGGGAEEVAEAEAVWRTAVDAWQRLRDGEETADDAPAEDEAPGEEAPTEDEAPGEEAPAEDEAPGEETPAPSDDAAEDADPADEEE